jgi:hypothetical protein
MLHVKFIPGVGASSMRGEAESHAPYPPELHGDAWVRVYGIRSGGNVPCFQQPSLMNDLLQVA